MEKESGHKARRELGSGRVSIITRFLEACYVWDWMVLEAELVGPFISQSRNPRSHSVTSSGDRAPELSLVRVTSSLHEGG